MLEAALSKWVALQPFSFPPQNDLILAEQGARRIIIDSEWGPAMPYDRYVPLKGRPAAIAAIPDVQGWPELAEALRVLNDPLTAVETCGCAVGIGEDRKSDAPTFVESYVDLFFSQSELRLGPTNSIRLAAHALGSVEGCESWWAQVLICLQKLKGITTNDHWSLTVRVRNNGRSEAEARELWAKTFTTMSLALAAFRIE